MEQNKVRLIIMSLGGSPDPLIKSIMTFNPEKVIFFASHDSVPLSHEILSASNKKPASEFVITDNPNSLFNCYSKARKCIDRAQQGDLPRDEIMVDYTGGTKVMSAALLLASLGRSYRFNYVGGVQRNKDGIGTVIDGHEEMFSEASPWSVFAEEERRQIVILFNRRRFSAVIEIIETFDRDLPAEIRKYFQFVRLLSEGFLKWDQFEHKTALRYLDRGITELSDYISLYPDPELETFSKKVLTCKEYLNYVVEKTQSLKTSHKILISDLLNNARRKIADKRFDDAAARIYRALELFGQIIFKEVAGCDNDKVKLEIVPDKIRKEFSRKYLDPHRNVLKLPLSATFKYLEAKGHEVGERFFKREKEIRNIQSNRNDSILAHGLKPVTERGINSILKTVSDFIQEIEYIDFPELP